MDELKELELHQIIGNETLKELPLTIKLLDHRLKEQKNGPSYKVLKNEFYNDNRYSPVRFHKPISKML